MRNRCGSSRRAFPENALVLAPRGQSGTPLGGFGWHAHMPGSWPGVDDFEPAMQGLLDLLTPGNLPKWNGKKVSLVGFSQGAALGSVLTLKRPQQVRLLAMLSGFLPENAGSLVRWRTAQRPARIYGARAPG